MSSILNLNGSCLTLASLALIAEMLERGGDVIVSNCAVRSDAPVAKSLGYEVFREERDGYWHTSIEHIKPPFTAHQFWTPAESKEGTPTEPARTFMGKRLVLCSYLEQDVVYMHPDSLFQLTGCRPEGITQAGVTVPPKENHPA